MNRRNFFSVLAAPFIAPMIPVKMPAGPCVTKEAALACFNQAWTAASFVPTLKLEPIKVFVRLDGEAIAKAIGPALYESATK